MKTIRIVKLTSAPAAIGHLKTTLPDVTVARTARRPATSPEILYA